MREDPDNFQSHPSNDNWPEQQLAGANLPSAYRDAQVVADCFEKCAQLLEGTQLLSNEYTDSYLEVSRQELHEHLQSEIQTNLAALAGVAEAVYSHSVNFKEQQLSELFDATQIGLAAVIKAEGTLQELNHELTSRSDQSVGNDTMQSMASASKELFDAHRGVQAAAELQEYSEGRRATSTTALKVGGTLAVGALAVVGARTLLSRILD